jgi:uncharacterized membrane protein
MPHCARVEFAFNPFFSETRSEAEEQRRIYEMQIHPIAVSILDWL